MASAPPAGADTSPLDGIAWDSLGYYTADGALGALFYVPTSSRTFGGRSVEATSGDFQFTSTTPEVRAGKGLQALWTPTCRSADPQRMVLSRTVYLPGRPATLLVNLLTLVQDLGGHHGKNPIAWVELRLNGHPLARVQRGVVAANSWSHFDVTDKADLVLPGANTLRVVAQKSTTKRSWGYCTQKPHGVPDFGVAAEIAGFPEADLSVVVPTTDGTTVIDAVARITNDGPSASVGDSGRWFAFETGAPTAGSATVAALTLESPAGACTTETTPVGLRAQCPQVDLLPQQSFEIQIHVTVAGACPYSIPTWWTVTARWNDPDWYEDNTGGRPIRCGT